MPAEKRFAAALKRLEDDGHSRSLQPAHGVDFSSNDYLSFAHHPALRQAALEWIERGEVIGSGGSRLLRGNHPAHGALEEFAADYFGAERALYFATGFQANHAIFSTLPDRHDVVIYDEFVHASVRDGIQGGFAKAYKFKHNDVNDCERVIRRARDNGAQEIFIAVESLYSMDGDFAPLSDFSALCERYEALLIVDEAHATGIWGLGGKGLATAADNIITLHTGGKALGVAGGLVCASRTIIDTLINKARPFIYSTAPLPLQAALLHRALQLSHDEPQHRLRLHDLCDYARQKLPVSSLSQIIPVVLGDSEVTLNAAAMLQKNGFDIRAIRPPTVPEGTARLRISLNTSITESDIDKLAELLR
jgi:8-amino-7-oxononanoate synthase